MKSLLLVTLLLAGAFTAAAKPGKRQLLIVSSAGIVKKDMVHFQAALKQFKAMGLPIEYLQGRSERFNANLESFTLLVRRAQTNEAILAAGQSLGLMINAYAEMHVVIRKAHYTVCRKRCEDLVDYLIPVEVSLHKMTDAYVGKHPYAQAEARQGKTPHLPVVIAFNNQPASTSRFKRK